MNRPARWWLVLSLIVPWPVAAQVDRAALTKRVAEAQAAVPAAQAEAKTACAAMRTALANPDHKLQGAVDEIANKLEGTDFDAAIGTQRLISDQLADYVAEPALPATRAALAKLATALAGGSLALLRADALAELSARLDQLDQALADQSDCGSLLRDLTATCQKLRRANALPPAERAGLLVMLAKEQAKVDTRVAQEQLGLAKQQMAQLETDWRELETGLRAKDAGVRDSAFARFDDAQRGIATALALVPEADRDGAALRTKLRELASRADVIYAQAYGAATLPRVRGVLENYVNEFEGWETEAATAPMADYVNIDGAGIGQLNHPRTAALLARVRQWSAFLAADDDFLRARVEPPVAAYVAEFDRHSATAVQRLAKVASALADEFAANPPADDRARDRLGVLADWELRLLLQDAAAQWPLVDRLHRLMDDYDRKVLGAEAALAKARLEATAATEANWPRMTGIQPLTPGFEPAQAAKFSGRLVRLLEVRDRRADFAAPDADLVFDLDGVLFAATYRADVKAWLAQEWTRLQLPPVDGDQPLELIVVVQGQASLRLRGPRGAEDGLDVPVRRVEVTGWRGVAAAFAVR